MQLLAAAAVASLAFVTVLLARRIRALDAETLRLAEQVRELSARLEAAEHGAEGALARVEIAEAVLLDKGVADEEDLEAARARFAGEAADVPREGELN